MIFCIIYFDTIFWYVFILVHASGFSSDFLQPLPFENTFFARSPMVPKLGHFQCVLWASFQVCFFFRFSLIFDAIQGSMLHYFSEKTFWESLQKRSPQTQMREIRDYAPAQRLPDSPPGTCTSQTRSNSLSSRCCSNWCPCLWFRKMNRKWLFELASIAN